MALFQGEQDATRDPLPHRGSHAPAQEREIHDADHQRTTLDRPFAHEDGLAQAGFLAGLAETVGVALRVPETERVGRDHLGEALYERALIEQDLDVGPGRDAEMIGALGAGPEIPLELLLIQDLAAFLALGPEAVRQLPFPLRRLEPFF